MRLVALTIMIICLSGCFGGNVKAPVTHHTDTLELMEKPNIQVDPIPEKPTAKGKEVDGEQVVVFSVEGADQLILMRKQALKNTELLKTVLDVNDALVDERNALVKMAKEQERRSNDLAEEYARTEEKLRHEEQMRAIEKFGYQLLIILGIGAGL